MELLKLNELTKKKLDETYVVVYAIKNEVNIKKADIIEKNDIYTLIGVDIKGIRHLLNVSDQQKHVLKPSKMSSTIKVQKF